MFHTPGLVNHYFRGFSFSHIPVPPRIVDSLSSSDMVQTEGSNVTLECLASGSPEPEVVWRREDAREITVDKNNTGECQFNAINQKKAIVKRGCTKSQIVEHGYLHILMPVGFLLSFN